jgi:hypothetical protein
VSIFPFMAPNPVHNFSSSLVGIQRDYCKYEVEIRMVATPVGSLLRVTYLLMVHEDKRRGDCWGQRTESNKTPEKAA